MEEPKQLSVSELRKKFESKPSTSSTPSTTKPIQSTTTQPPRQAFTGNAQLNGATDNHKPAASEPDTANLSVKERMKMFDKSKNQQETQPVPLQPKKTQVPPQATVNSNKDEANNVSAQPEKQIVSEPEPIQVVEQQEEVPEEPAQIEQEEVHQEPEQIQEIQQEEIAPQVVAEEAVHEVQEEKIEQVVEEVQEPNKEPEIVQVQEKQEEQAPVVVETEETKASETKNPVLNRNAGFASEMNAMLAKKGLRSNEDSPIKSEQSKAQGLPHGDAYTEALLTRPTSDPRKKKAKLVFVDDEDF